MLIAGDPRTHRTCPTIMQRRQLLARQTELDSIMLATFGLLRIKNSTSSRMFCVLAETVLCIVFWSEIENERENPFPPCEDVLYTPLIDIARLGRTSPTEGGDPS